MRLSLQLTSLFVLLATAVSGQNQNLSAGSVFDGEPYLAIDPANPQHIAVAWMGYKPFSYIVIKTGVTFDGGQNWSATVDIPHTNPLFGSADPSLAFDNNGNLFLSYIDYDVAIDSGYVYVRKSSDGGLTWGAPVEVINAHSDPGKYPVDRPWISIDRSGGAFDGNIYITTMPPTVFGWLAGPYHPYFIRSTDGGASFAPWTFLDTTGWLAGTVIRQPTPFHTVSGDGTFHAVYPSWVGSQNLLAQYIFASSNNAGSSFSYSAIALPNNMIFKDSLAKKGYPLLADPTDPNHLVFLNLVQPFGDGDVYAWDSHDGGMTWPDSVRVNDDPVGNNRMQDMVWGDFDIDGDLIVSWRDRRNGGDSTYETASEIWGAMRLKDSSHFSANFRISDTLIAYDTVLTSNGNDFMCIQLMNDTLSAAWGDPRDGKLNIWFERLNVNGTPALVKQLSCEEIPEVRIAPNPFTSTLMISGKDVEEVTMCDENGKIVLRTTETGTKPELRMHTEDLPAGIYILRITTKSGAITRRAVKVNSGRIR